MQGERHNPTCAHCSVHWSRILKAIAMIQRQTDSGETIHNNTIQYKKTYLCWVEWPLIRYERDCDDAGDDCENDEGNDDAEDPRAATRDATLFRFSGVAVGPPGRAVKRPQVRAQRHTRPSHFRVHGCKWKQNLLGVFLLQGFLLVLEHKSFTSFLCFR